MDEDKIPETELSTEQEVEQPNKLLPEVIKNKGGRPKAEDLPDLMVDYLRIYQLTSVGCYTPSQIVDYFGKEGKKISESKVLYACKWCREKWPILTQREYLVDSENVFSTRIREYTTMIEIAKKGEPIYALNGEPLLDAAGNERIRVDKDRIDRLMRDRTALEKSLMELRGQLKVNSMVIQNTNILGDAHIEMVKKLTLFEIMAEDDKEKYLEIFDKYGKIEPEETPT